MPHNVAVRNETDGRIIPYHSLHLLTSLQENRILKQSLKKNCLR